MRAAVAQECTQKAKKNQVDGRLSPRRGVRIFGRGDRSSQWRMLEEWLWST